METDCNSDVNLSSIILSAKQNAHSINYEINLWTIISRLSNNLIQKNQIIDEKNRNIEELSNELEDKNRIIEDLRRNQNPFHNQIRNPNPFGSQMSNQNQVRI